MLHGFHAWFMLCGVCMFHRFSFISIHLPCLYELTYSCQSDTMSSMHRMKPSRLQRCRVTWALRQYFVNCIPSVAAVVSILWNVFEFVRAGSRFLRPLGACAPGSHHLTGFLEVCRLNEFFASAVRPFIPGPHTSTLAPCLHHYVPQCCPGSCRAWLNSCAGGAV